MHYYLITGASRGLGAALVAQLLQADRHVSALARTQTPDWLAELSGPKLDYTALDLADQEALDRWLKDFLPDLAQKSLSSFTLIHNAGILAPIGLIGQNLDANALQKSLHVNLLAPIRLTQEIVTALQANPIPKRILGISSGAGRKPYEGWSSYCTSKAGLDMYLQVLAKEQESQAHPFQAVSLAPGVIDTEMQAEIRSQEADRFPNVARFHALKADGNLWSPQFVAERVDAYLHHPKFGGTVIDDIRTWEG